MASFFENVTSTFNNAFERVVSSFGAPAEEEKPSPVAAPPAPTEAPPAPFYSVTPIEDEQLIAAANNENNRRNPDAIAAMSYEGIFHDVQNEQEELEREYRVATLKLQYQNAEDVARIDTLKKEKQQLEEAQQSLTDEMEKNIQLREKKLAELTPVFIDAIPATKQEGLERLNQEGFALPAGTDKEKVSTQLSQYFASITAITQQKTALDQNNAQIDKIDQQYDAATKRIEERIEKTQEPVEQKILANNNRMAELDASYKDDKKADLFQHVADKVNASDLPAEKKKDALKFLADARLKSNNSEEFLDKIDEPSSPVRQFIGDKVEAASSGRSTLITISFDDKGHRIAKIGRVGLSDGNEQLIDLDKQGGTLNLSGIQDGNKVTMKADKGVEGVTLIGTEGKEINFVGPGVESSYVKQGRVQMPNGRTKSRPMKDAEGHYVMGHYVNSEYDKNANPAEAFKILGDDKENSTMLAASGVRAEARGDYLLAKRQERVLESAANIAGKTDEIEDNNAKLLAALQKSGVDLSALAGNIRGSEDIVMDNNHGRYASPEVVAANQTPARTAGPNGP